MTLKMEITQVAGALSRVWRSMTPASITPPVPSSYDRVRGGRKAHGIVVPFRVNLAHDSEILSTALTPRSKSTSTPAFRHGTPLALHGSVNAMEVSHGGEMLAGWSAVGAASE